MKSQLEMDVATCCGCILASPQRVERTDASTLAMASMQVAIPTLRNQTTNESQGIIPWASKCPLRINISYCRSHPHI